MVHTKIVGTIGPVTCNPDSLLALAKAGMSVARLNGSHSNLEWHRAAIKLIRDTLPDMPILLDIPGRKIRTTMLSHEPTFAAGDTVVLTTDTSYDGRIKVPVNYGNLHADVKVGDIILADDGTLRFTVEAIEGRDIICRSGTRGTLRSRKGINVPFVRLKTAMVTDHDRQMVEFARETGVDFIGISFVESAAHVRAVQELVGGKRPQVLAKIENQGGIDNTDEIIEAADAIMIDRGDLSVETNLETTVIYQKKIIDAARMSGKPVIVATEMLNSMIESDYPSKAEIADITNAVLDGCSATMLSGETAIGRFPVAAVELMRRVADAAFVHLRTGPRADERFRRLSPSQAIEDAIALILTSVPVTKVVAITAGGYAARMLSARSVDQPIFAVSDDEGMARAFNLYSGVEGFYLNVPFPQGGADHIKAAIKMLYERGKLDETDLILVTGRIYPRSGTRMNLIQIHHMLDLIEAGDMRPAAEKPH